MPVRPKVTQDALISSTLDALDMSLDSVEDEDVKELYGTGDLAVDDASDGPSADQLAGLNEGLRASVAAGIDEREMQTSLAKRELNARSAVVPLYRLMVQKPSSPSDRSMTVMAASGYMLLVRFFPDVFQPMVFRAALNSLRGNPLDAAHPGSKRKSADTRHGPTAKRKQSAAMDSDDDDVQSETYGGGDGAVSRGSKNVIYLRYEAMEDILLLLSAPLFSLCGYSEPLANLISVTIDLVVGYDSFEMGVVSESAKPFVILSAVLDKKHGDLEDTGKVLCQGMLPVLLLRPNGGGLPGSTVPKAAAAGQKAAVKFLTALVHDGAGADVQIHETIIVALCQQMCLKVSEKAEYRASCCAAINALCTVLKEEHASTFTRFLSSYSKNEKALYRAFACDLALTLFNSLPEMNLNTSASINIIKDRACDKAPTVRAKAISSLVACLEGKRGSDLLDNGTAITSLLALARARIRDEKAVVRKTALQMLGSLLRLLNCDAVELGAVAGETIDPSDVSILAERCRDSALNTRKASLQVLTGVLMSAPESQLLRETWIKTALPMVLDQQVSVKDACCQLAHTIIIEPVLVKTKSVEQDLAWHLMDNIRSPEMRQYFHKVVSTLNLRTISEGKSNYKLSKGHVDAASSKIKAGKQHVVGAWVLLEELSQVMPEAVDTKLVWSKWEALQPTLPNFGEGTDEQCIASSALRTLQRCRFPEALAPIAIDGVLAAIRLYNLLPEVTKAAVECLVALTEQISGSEVATKKKLHTCCSSILQDCDAKLYDYMFGPGAYSDMSTDNDIAVALFTVGEVATVSPKSMPKRLLSILQAMISPADNADSSTGVRVSVPVNVRAHAVVSLGKVCLNDEMMAKKCVAAFSRELQDRSGTPVIRNNIIFILSDLCRRFTSLVDPHLALLAQCLLDPLPLVRKQTMVLLAGLLQEDYLKWKGPLFFRFLRMTVDADPEVALQTKYVLFTLFHKRNSTLIYSHFVEAIFHMNDFMQHEGYNQFSQSSADRELFCLPGKDNQPKRLAMYAGMLENLPDEQKLNITARLCHDILARCADTDKASAVLHLDDEKATQVLHDAMVLTSIVKYRCAAVQHLCCLQVVLASKELKLAATRKVGAAGAADIDEDLGRLLLSAR
jgi:condensin-2 complex subunit D3